MSVQKYTKAQVTLVDRGRLLLLVLDGALTFLQRARAALEAGDLPTFGETLRRAQAIICELLANLDYGVADGLPQRLASLYQFMLLHLAAANAKQSVRHVDEVIAVLRPVAEAYHQVIEGAAAPAASV